jgi:hypothetical protein
MASTGRFQSRLFSLLSQQSLHLRDRLTQTLRQAKVTLLWGAQVALYPIYVLFQSARMVDRQLRQATRQAYPQLQAVKRVMQRILHPMRPALAPKADTPVRRVLRAVKDFLSPTLPPAQMGLGLNAASSTDESTIAALSTLQLAETQAIAATLKLSGTVAERLSTLATIESVGEIQGIASLLSNRAIVLVTERNQILDILTPEQQWQLRQQIAWEVAGYWRERKRLQAARRSLPPFLPLPLRRKNLLPPVQHFRQLMAWMQTSPLAVATNLFQESTLVAIVQVSLDSQLAIARQLGGRALQLLAPAEPSPTPAKWQMPLLPAANTAVHWAQWLFQRSTLQFSPVGGALANPSSPPTLSTSSPSPSSTSSALKVAPSANLISVGQISAHQASLDAIAPPSHFAPVAPPINLLQAATEAAVSLVTESATPSMHHKASYIETHATFIGYVRHPLEQLLTWLDRGMAWLEERIPQWWNWLQEQAMAIDLPTLRQKTRELWQQLRLEVSSPDFLPHLRQRLMQSWSELRQQTTTETLPLLQENLNQGWQKLQTWVTSDVVPTVQTKVPEFQAKATQLWQRVKQEATDAERISNLKQTALRYQQQLQEIATSEQVAQIKQTVVQQQQRLQDRLSSSNWVANAKTQALQLWQRFRR